MVQSWKRMPSTSADFFIAVYTHQVKSYCDRLFFRRLHTIAGQNSVHVVDNSPDDTYTKQLILLCEGYDTFAITRITVPPDPVATLFLRNVCDSANYLREAFLQTDCRHFMIIESDVLPPLNVLGRFARDIGNLPDNWGVFGAVYYKGRHDFTLRGIHSSDLVFSGCTVYRRELIEKCAFRWSDEHRRSFPDAWMSTDAIGNDYSLWNHHDIRCRHLQSYSERDLAALSGESLSSDRPT